jgi:hypothetical protein
MDLKERGCEGVDWVQLALVRVQWRSIVNNVVNLKLHKRLESVHQLRNYQLLNNESASWII